MFLQEVWYRATMECSHWAKPLRLLDLEPADLPPELPHLLWQLHSASCRLVHSMASSRCHELVPGGGNSDDWRANQEVLHLQLATAVAVSEAGEEAGLPGCRWAWAARALLSWLNKTPVLPLACIIFVLQAVPASCLHVLTCAALPLCPVRSQRQRQAMCVAHLTVMQAAAAAISTLQPMPGCPPEFTQQRVRYAADALLRLLCECPALLLEDPQLMDRLAEELESSRVGSQELNMCACALWAAQAPVQ